MAVHVHLLRRDGLAATGLGFTPPSRGLVHLWQVPLIIVTCATVTMVELGVLLHQEPSGADAIEGIAAAAAWPTQLALLLVTAVVTPLSEEVLFLRRLLCSSLTRSLPTIAAAITSSAVFAAVHVVAVLMLGTT